MKLYRCIKKYFSEYDNQFIYSVGQICMFKEDEKFVFFDQYFEEIEDEDLM